VSISYDVRIDSPERTAGEEFASDVSTDDPFLGRSDIVVPFDCQRVIDGHGR
jgi:hypothetical protein